MFAVAAVVLSVQPAALANSFTAPDWTKQAPPAHPPARILASMAYDAATGNIVLFGGQSRTEFGDTWTWNGSTWTKQAPATSPPARSGASMAYDAATGNIVLFGGAGRSNHHHGLFGDTWTWNGSTWTKQAPATHPSARNGASMAYDVATGNVVLFGGDNGSSGPHPLGDTWTWDGSTWTKQAPAAHPSARFLASMAYDAATGNVVLLGGGDGVHLFSGTWTWDGSTWTKQAPAAHPSAREAPSMAYDAATANTVLFGGDNNHSSLSDTWTWDGSAWTKQAPAISPPAREYGSMAYDAATGNVVLFGGGGGSSGLSPLGDTWTWGGSG